jgi:protein TonB
MSPLWQSNGGSGGLLRWTVALSILGHAALLLNLPGRQQNDSRPIILQASLRQAPAVQVSNNDQSLAASQPPQAQRFPPRHLATTPTGAPPVAPSARAGAAGPAMPSHGAATPANDTPASPPAANSTPAAALTASSAAPAATRETAPSAPANDSAALERYGRSLAELLARQQQYPRLAAMRGWEGEVRVQVRVARKGNIVDVQLAHSSGFAVLDQQALQLLAAAALPPLPDSVRGSEIQLIVPIHFKLNKAT